MIVMQWQNIRELTVNVLEVGERESDAATR